MKVNKSYPEVTIIIPVYNEEKHLEETLESLINQTYKNIRIHISNNYSTDSSLEIANRFALKDKRIRVFTQKTNLPASENFTFLINSVQSPYIFLIGGHDLLDRECIGNCVNRITHNKIVCVYPFAAFIGEAVRFTKANSEIEMDNENNLTRILKLINNLKAGTAVYSLYKTEVLEKVKIDKLIDADLFWLFQVAEQGSIVSTTSNKVLFYRREDRVESLKNKRKRYENDVGISNHSFESMIIKFMEHINENTDFNKIEKEAIFIALLNRYQIKGKIDFKSVKIIAKSFDVSLKKLRQKYIRNIPKMYFLILKRFFRNSLKEIIINQRFLKKIVFER